MPAAAAVPVRHSELRPVLMGGDVTEGFALGFAWLMFLGSLAVLAYFLLRDKKP